MEENRHRLSQRLNQASQVVQNENIGKARLARTPHGAFVVVLNYRLQIILLLSPASDFPFKKNIKKNLLLG